MAFNTTSWRFFLAPLRSNLGCTMAILITGGCGFIGTNLIARLNEAGIGPILVFDNETVGCRDDLAGLRARFIFGDVRDRTALDAALEGVRAVVHLAADTRVVDSIGDPLLNFDVNVRGTLNLLEAMRARGITRLVNASTGGAIIGEVERLPVHEELVPRPPAPYGASKLAVEGYCSAYASSYGFSAVSLRFSNVYGPRSIHKGSIVATFFKRILAEQKLVVYGNGRQVRDFIHVNDVCHGIIAALNSRSTGPVHLGSGRPTSVNELIETMRQVVAPKPIAVSYQPARRGEVNATYTDISRARRELGFSPSTNLIDGLTSTWAWFSASFARSYSEPLEMGT
jgi:UDP-glucose 4-epimerase